MQVTKTRETKSMETIRVSGRFGLVAMVLLATTLGCGQGEYEAAMNDSIKGIAFDSNFIQGLSADPAEIIKDVAELRLPAFIDNFATSLTMTSKDNAGDLIDPRRVQPPGIKIPGFRFSYEKFEQLGGRNTDQPLYVYFGSRPGNEPIKSVTGPILQGARKIRKNINWTTEELDTPDRGRLKFQKLSVKGIQDFEFDPRGGQIEKKAGQLDIYVHSTPEHHIIVGFRTTDAIAEMTKMFDLAPFSLGKLTVLGAEDGGA